MAEKFGNVVKDIHLQIQVAEPVLTRISPKKAIQDMSVKFRKLETKNHESSQRKSANCRRMDINSTRAALSSETPETRGKGATLVQGWENDLRATNPAASARLSCRTEGREGVLRRETKRICC